QIYVCDCEVAFLAAVIRDARQMGGNAKRLGDTSPGPWIAWRTKARHARCIRFVESYCVPPKGHGAGKPLRLAPYQKEWLEEVLADGVSSAVMEIPRGNGKSTFLAAVGTWATFDADDGGAPQVPVVATTVSQAIRSVYGVATAMITACSELERRALVFSAIGATKVVVPFTGGEMFPISNLPDGLQGLDPSLAVCDEIGFMSVESWDSLLLASGKRPQSLAVGIGTPGFDRDNALWMLRQRAAEGLIPGFRYTEFAAPDGCAVDDETAWREANPALAAGFMNVQALRTAVMLSPESHFRIFRLGQWVEGTESWLGSDGGKTWDLLRDPWEFELAAPTWVGVDVGLKRDSTAVVAVQRRPDGRLHVKARLWVPAEGDPVNISSVVQHIRLLDQTYLVEAVAYDPRFFADSAQGLENEGVAMVEVPQSVEMMVPAVGRTFEAIKRAELSHDGDSALTNHVLNAIPRFSERGFTLQKSKSRGRIDAAVALCLAVDRAAQPKTVPAMVAWG
ncbi:MAG TPA: terminase TerL endonuclease subunit, partial [Jiangellaceae bacterium]|nr:terminase TerL endonuclease subunit [Jiangellaceae bacterium]